MTDESALTPYALEFRDVSFSYAKRPLIEHFSACIPRGRFTCMLGPNGCGKSTTLKLADGLLKPHAGSVLVDGVPTLSLSAKKRARRLAVLAQSPRPPAMSVESMVACGRYAHQGHRDVLSPDDRMYIEGAIDLLGLQDLRTNEVRRLSGGERQRAYLAMVIAQNAPIIVMDEPVAFLDVDASHDTMRLARELVREHGKTVVMVIHDIDLALRYADSLIVMKHGRMLGSGSVGEMLEAKCIQKAFGISIERYSSQAGDAYCAFPVTLT